MLIRTTLAKILNDDSLGRVWLIQQGTEAVAYIILIFGYSLEYQGRDAFIDDYLKANYQKQGLGISTIKFGKSVYPS